MRRLPTLWLVLFVLLPIADAPRAGAGELSPEKWELVRGAIRDAMRAQEIPGLSVALVVDRKLDRSEGFGLADVENGVPATEQTVYRLASISKPITAVALLQLVERGKLDLDAPVQKYVPSFPEKPWPVTTRQLLGHLGGIRHYAGNEVNSTRHYVDLTKPLDIFKDDDLKHEPGTKFLYTTYGFNLLGCVLEGAADDSFLLHLRKNVFEPSGMETIRADDSLAIIPHRAQGYRKSPQGELRNSALADTSNKIPGGGLCSTAGDLARFAAAVQADGLLKRETKERMFTRQKTKDGQETTYGLGWSLATRGGRKVVSHGGGQQRVSTLLSMVPEEGFAVALMSNLEGATLGPLAEKIATIVLGEPGGDPGR